MDGRAAELYLRAEDSEDSVLVWPAAEGGSSLWIRAPLPEDELIRIAESVIVDLNRFSDLITIPVFDPEDVTLPELVERALADAPFIARVREYARADAQAGVYMSEEYNAFVRDYQARHISPERERAIARVSQLIASTTGMRAAARTSCACLGRSTPPACPWAPITPPPTSPTSAGV